MYFRYNADGIRTYKSYYNHYTMDMYHVNYVLDGTKIISEHFLHEITDEEYTLEFYYDSNDSPVGFCYNGNDYYYRKNLQGDIIAILNTSGTKVVEYSYNAWGEVLSVTGSLSGTIGRINPFRYRGYYYDTETGFYYLQSRCYDPVVGRLINSDAPQMLMLVLQSNNVIETNLYSYCVNDPINFADPSGEWLIQLICGVVGAAIFGTVAYVLSGLLVVDGTARALITTGFALVGGALGALFGPSIVGKIAPKALKWVNDLEKIINKKSRFRPIIIEGQTILGFV